MPGLRILLLATLIALVCDSAVAEPTDDALKWNEEGILFLKKGEYENAIERFGRAVKAMPEEAVLKRNLATARSSYGVALSKDGKLDASLVQLRHAVELDPDSELYRTNLGTVLYRLSKYAEALKELGLAVELNGRYAAARVALGRVHYRRGELAKAIGHWKVALALDPDRKSLVADLAKAKREFEAERDYDKLEGEHFEISWNGDEDRSVGGRVLRILEDAYREVGREMGIFPEKSVRVVLYGEKEFRKVTGAQDWVGGLYDGSIRLPVRNFAGAEREIRDKIFHEYTHVAVRSITDRCPVWLNEGLAQVLEGRNRRQAAGLVKKALGDGRLLSQKQLAVPYSKFEDAGRARLAYAEALLLTHFVLDEHGPEPVRRFLKALGAGRKADVAAREAFSRTLDQLYEAWRQTL